MIDRRHNEVPRIRSLLTLCALMLCVIFGGSYLTYRQNATAIRQSAEKRLTRDVSVAKSGVERAMSSLLADMESWVRQPAMVSILDDDIDHEIAQFLDVVREQNNFLQEVACITASGEVLVSTTTSLTGKSVDSRAQLREKFENGIRCEMVEADNVAIVTVPIFWQFDERELIGLLRARVAYRAFLPHQPEWWDGLATASGRVIAQQGVTMPTRIDLASSDETYPLLGRVIKKTALIEHPARVIAPAWFAVAAQHHEALYGQLNALRLVAFGTSIGSALVAVVLILGFTRRQRSLVERLAERGETLQGEVTAHKRTMGTLRESEERHRAITECAQDAIITSDAEGIIRLWNPAAERIFGHPAAEAVGKKLLELIVPPQYHDAKRKALKEFAKTGRGNAIGKTLELTGLRKDGTEFPIELSLTAYKDRECFLGVALVRDITGRKNAEAEIQRLSNQNRLVLDSAGEGIYGLDLQGNTTFINPAAARMLGWQVEELIGRSQHDVLHHTRHDGAPYPREECPIHAAFEDGTAHHVDSDVFWRKDGTSFPVEYVSTPIREDGKLAGAVVVFRDTTERQQMEERFRHSQKMQAIGSLVAGVAHDYNNQLQAVLASLEMALEDLTPDSPTYVAVDVAERAARRSLEITKGLLGFCRGESKARSRIDTGKLLGEAGQVLQRVLPAKIRFKLSHDESLWPIRGNATQIQQVLMNLVVNARDAMPTGGTLTVSAANRAIDANEERSRPTRVVLISISDTGVGMAPEVVSRVFDPFFTTKERGQGTGLGLSLTHGMIKSHGGWIEVRSSEGEGTTFDVFLPACESPEREGEPQESAVWAVPSPLRGSLNELETQTSKE